MAIEPVLQKTGGIEARMGISILYPVAHQSTGEEEEDEAVGFRGGGASGVCSISSWGEARGVPRSSSAAKRNTWEGGWSHGLAERDLCKGVFGFQGMIFSTRRGILVAAARSSQRS
jgi:hypothetical protein